MPTLPPEHERLYTRIYTVVRQIPRGKVATYGQIAEIVGDCTARVVGYAMAASADDVPWQRVINAQGKVSPRSDHWSTEVQRLRLEEEGVAFDANYKVNFAEVRWAGPSLEWLLENGFTPPSGESEDATNENRQMPIPIVTTLEPGHFAGLEELQRACYPTLAKHELMQVEHFASQYAVFREGQFVVLAGDHVIGQGSGFFINFDFDNPSHRFREICDYFYFRNHDPDGEYYYGADISVHPEHRGLGIGKLLYRARKDLAAHYNRRGIVAGGMLPGFAQHKQQMSAQEYVAKVVAGELFDSTLSFQLKSGFRVRGLLHDYLEDSAADNWATLIVWENPEYRKT